MKCIKKSHDLPVLLFSRLGSVSVPDCTASYIGFEKSVVLGLSVSNVYPSIGGTVGGSVAPFEPPNSTFVPWRKYTFCDGNEMLGSITLPL